MENASKALIIAGAILVSILIIGLGMYLYTTASGVFDSNQLKEQQARTINLKNILVQKLQVQM